MFFNGRCAATVSVVEVRTLQKFKLEVSDTPKFCSEQSPVTEGMSPGEQLKVRHRKLERVEGGEGGREDGYCHFEKWTSPLSMDHHVV